MVEEAEPDSRLGIPFLLMRLIDRGERVKGLKRGDDECCVSWANTRSITAAIVL